MSPISAPNAGPHRTALDLTDQRRPVLIRRARLIDPANGRDFIGDLLTANGQIAAAQPLIDAAPDGALIIEAAGLIASPGFIDLHAHLREPGYEYKETIATGAQAGARGGFTTICCMPNTDPPIDSESVVEFVLRRARDAGPVRILPIGCVTRGRAGRELADLEELAAAGAVAFSDDGDPIHNPNLMRMALAYSADLGRPVINHCQDLPLSGDGVMAEGPVATRLGLPGIPPAAEDAMIARDIALAEAVGGRLHLPHLSTAGSIPLLRRAKERGLTVSAEVCPHHLTATDDWVLCCPGETRRPGKTQENRPPANWPTTPPPKSTPPPPPGRRRRPDRSPRRWRHRLHRHRPRPPRRRQQAGHLPGRRLWHQRAGNRPRFPAATVSPKPHPLARPDPPPNRRPGAGLGSALRPLGIAGPPNPGRHHHL